MMLSRRTNTKSIVSHVRLQSTKVGGDRSYDAAIAALNGLQSNFSVVKSFMKHGREQNEKSIPEMLEWVRRIGYEARDFDRLNPVHIAGTKGKGSTSSFISSILAQYLPTRRSIQAERLPSVTGLFTSPHLRFVRERIQLDNQPISEDAFARCFWEVWDRLESHESSQDHINPQPASNKPTYFRYLTLMALHWYMRQAVGTAVIECGVGGEYDSTNILVKPSVAGITSLGIDHEALLGNTIDQIAWHKAGIFKEDVPAFSVEQPDRAMSVLRTRAQDRGTRLNVVPVHAAVPHIKLGIGGAFQKVNASLAVAVSAQHLRRLGFTGIPDPLDSNSSLPPEFVRGLESTRLGGRCEMRADKKLQNMTWYIDGGHTLESIELAGQWFASNLADPESRGAARILVFNQQKRDAVSLARHLHRTLTSALEHTVPFEHVIFCSNVTYRDAGYKTDLMSINEDKDRVTGLHVQHELAAAWDAVDPVAATHVVGSIEEAVEKARYVADGRKTHVMATGSLHLVGGLLDVLESENVS